MPLLLLFASDYLRNQWKGSEKLQAAKVYNYKKIIVLTIGENAWNGREGVTNGIHMCRNAKRKICEWTLLKKLHYVFYRL
jgi:hypothetical protein